MSAYGVLHDSFWDGPTGVQIREHGGRAGQLVALYLHKNHDDNMIGLYGLNLAVMRERIGTLKPREVEQAMVALGKAGFAYYDTTTCYVWVLELAKFRLRLDGHPLKDSDNRSIGAAALYKRAKPNPFLELFFARYRKELTLLKKRTFEGAASILGSPFEAPSKPETDTSSSNRIRTTEHQEDQEHRADARPSHGLLKKLWHIAYDEIATGALDGTLDSTSLVNIVKSRAGEAGIDYASERHAVERAQDAVLHERKVSA